MKSNQLDTFKSHLIRLIKEELEGGEDEKQAGLEKTIYDTVLAPSDIDAAIAALSDVKNYGIYAQNLRDPKAVLRVFGPSVPATKGRVAKETWDQSNENEKLSKVIDIKSRAPQEWAKVEQSLQSKFDDWSVENDNDSFNEFIITLDSKELPMDFFGKYASTYFATKTPDNLKKYSGVMTKDDQFIVSGDKIIFPQKKNPFETKDYLEKVLKTIMGNAKIQYTLSQQESGDQPKTTSNTQGKVEKINFVKTFDSPELAAKFKRLIPKDFAEKTTVEGGKITVADITDPQKKNLMATALKFVADNTKKPVKEGISLDVKDGTKIQNVNNNETYTVDRKGSNTVYAKNSKGKVITIDSKYFDAYKIIENMKESVKDQIKKAIEEVIREKKLTKAEINKKEDIVKAMKGTTKLPEPAMYAIATAKAKKLAEGEGKMSAMDFLRNELPNMYDRDYNYEIADAMEQYSEYCNSGSTLEEGINYDNLTKNSTADLKSLIDIKNKELKKLKSGTNIPPLVQGQIKKLGAEISKIERELNSRKALNEEDVNAPLLLPSNILTKANAKVVDAKTFARFIKDIYDQTQKGETIDFSKNQNLKYVLDYLNKAMGEKPGTASTKL